MNAFKNWIKCIFYTKNFNASSFLTTYNLFNFFEPRNVSLRGSLGLIWLFISNNLLEIDNTNFKS